MGDRAAEFQQECVERTDQIVLTAQAATHRRRREPISTALRSRLGASQQQHKPASHLASWINGLIKASPQPQTAAQLPLNHSHDFEQRSENGSHNSPFEANQSLPQDSGQFKSPSFAFITPAQSRYVHRSPRLTKTPNSAQAGSVATVLLTPNLDDASASRRSGAAVVAYTPGSTRFVPAATPMPHASSSSFQYDSAVSVVEMKMEDFVWTNQFETPSAPRTSGLKRDSDSESHREVSSMIFPEPEAGPIQPLDTPHVGPPVASGPPSIISPDLIRRTHRSNSAKRKENESQGKDATNSPEKKQKKHDNASEDTPTLILPPADANEEADRVVEEVTGPLPRVDSEPANPLLERTLEILKQKFDFPAPAPPAPLSTSVPASAKIHDDHFAMASQLFKDIDNDVFDFNKESISEVAPQQQHQQPQLDQQRDQQQMPPEPASLTAEALFGPADITVEPAPSFVGYTAAGYEVPVALSKHSIEMEVPIIRRSSQTDDNRGGHTPFNKPVAVSKEFLKQAVPDLPKLADYTPVKEAHQETGGGVDDVLSSSLPLSLGGYTIGNGQAVLLSARELRKTETRLAEVEPSSGLCLSYEGKPVMPLSKDLLKRASETEAEADIFAPPPALGGFTTGLGAPIHIKKTALLNVMRQQDKLGEQMSAAIEDDDDDVLEPPALGGFSTAKGVPVTVKKSFLRKFEEDDSKGGNDLLNARKKFLESFEANDSRGDNDVLEPPALGGFATARGVPMTAKKSSLRKFDELCDLGLDSEANSDHLEPGQDDMKAIEQLFKKPREIKSSGLKLPLNVESQRDRCSVDVEKEEEEEMRLKGNRVNSPFATASGLAVAVHVSDQSVLAQPPGLSPLITPKNPSRHVALTGASALSSSSPVTPRTVPLGSLAVGSRSAPVSTLRRPFASPQPSPSTVKRPTSTPGNKPFKPHHPTTPLSAQRTFTSSTMVSTVRPEDRCVFDLKKIPVTPRLTMQQMFKAAPSSHERDDLLTFDGVKTEITHVGSNSAKDFRFTSVFFTANELASAQCICSGGTVVRLHNGSCGVDDFHQALLSTPGIRVQQCSFAWIQNHYRWIVWKLASQENRFPDLCAGANARLTVQRVMDQLKYRFEREINGADRSALRKICEGDESPNRLMVLFVAEINLSINSSGATTIFLSDGWYSIRTHLDFDLQRLVATGKLVLGMKVFVSGAEMKELPNPAPPLEIPSGAHLTISYNCTHLARWGCRLGFQKRKWISSLLHTIKPGAGSVPCIDVIVCRRYPIRHMETLPDDTRVFRNARAEAKAARLFELQRSKRLEAVEDYDASFSHALHSEDTSEKQDSTPLESLTDGHAIKTAIQRLRDPDEAKQRLSIAQQEALHEYEQSKIEERRKQVMEQQARNVLDLFTVRLLDTRHIENECLLTVWQPNDERWAAFAEGRRLRVFGSVAAVARRHASEHGGIQCLALSTSRNLMVQELGLHEATRHKWSRSTLVAHQLNGKARDSEVDLVGIVVGVESLKFGDNLVLCDATGSLVMIFVRDGLEKIASLDLCVRGNFLAIINVVVGERDLDLVNPKCRLSEHSCIYSNPSDVSLSRALAGLRHTLEERKLSLQQLLTEMDEQLVKYQQQQLLRRSTGSSILSMRTPHDTLVDGMVLPRMTGNHLLGRVEKVLQKHVVSVSWTFQSRNASNDRAMLWRHSASGISLYVGDAIVKHGGKADHRGCPIHGPFASAMINAVDPPARFYLCLDNGRTVFEGCVASAAMMEQILGVALATDVGGWLAEDDGTTMKKERIVRALLRPRHLDFDEQEGLPCSYCTVFSAHSEHSTPFTVDEWTEFSQGVLRGLCAVRFEITIRTGGPGDFGAWVVEAVKKIDSVDRASEC